MTELLPCPFCGGEAEIHPSNDWDRTFSGSTYYAWCDKCETRGDYYDTEAEAIAAWNTRAATTIGKVHVEVAPTVRTCKPVEKDGVMHCPECDYPLGIMSVPAFCAGCGAKVVEQ